jgi:hypothetical protein
MRLCILLAQLSSIVAAPHSHPSIQLGNLIQPLSKAIPTASSYPLQPQDDPNPKPKADEPQESASKYQKGCLIPAVQVLLEENPYGPLTPKIYNKSSISQGLEILGVVFGGIPIQPPKTSDYYNALLHSQNPAPRDPKHWVVSLLTSIIGAGHSTLERRDSGLIQFMNPRCNCLRGLKDVSDIPGTTIPENICQGLPIMWSNFVESAEYELVWEGLAFDLRETKDDLLQREITDALKKEIVKVLGTGLENDGNKHMADKMMKWPSNPARTVCCS